MIPKIKPSVSSWECEFQSCNSKPWHHLNLAILENHPFVFGGSKDLPAVQFHRVLMSIGDFFLSCFSREAQAWAVMEPAQVKENSCNDFNRQRIGLGSKWTELD